MRRGLVFGHFDMTHYGHIRLLRACRAQCDHLTVVVTGPGRRRPPMVPVEARLLDLAELRSVDDVRDRAGHPKAYWLDLIRPDVLFIGEEDPGTYPAPEVVRMPRTPGISSTLLRQWADEGGQ